MDVAFDDEAAEALIRRCRRVDELLQSQGWARLNAVDDAREDFSGGYAELFAECCTIEYKDRGRLAGTLDDLAQQVSGARARAVAERTRLAELAAWNAREAERDALRDTEPVGQAFVSGPYDPMPDTVPGRPPVLIAVFRAAPRTRTLQLATLSGKSSADPERLREWVAFTRRRDAELASEIPGLRGAWDHFRATCSWASSEGVSFLDGFVDLVNENSSDARWAAQIADAFAEAGTGSLSDFAVTLAAAPSRVSEAREWLLSGELSPAQVAAAWKTLAAALPGVRLQHYIEANSFELACLDGLPFSVMSQAGEHSLKLALDPEHPEMLAEAHRRMGFRPEERGLDRTLAEFRKDLEAIREALADARDAVGTGGAVQLVWFGRHDGAVTAGISMGDLDRAKKVGVFVSGMLSDVRQLPDSFDAFSSIRTGSADTAMVTWIGYRAPNFAEEPFQDRADSGAPRLASFLDGIAATRSGNPIDRFVTMAHSYGTNVLAEALKITKAPVDTFASIGSAGLKIGTTTKDLNVEQIYATHADGDDIADGIGQHVHFGPFPGGGIRLEPRVDPREMSGAQVFSSERTAGGKAVTMHNLVSPVGVPVLEDLDGISAEDEVGYLNDRSSTVRALTQIMNGENPDELE